MVKILVSAVALLVLSLAAPVLHAQAAAAAPTTTVNGNAFISWTLPTKTLDGGPLTDNNALTKIQLFFSSSPIADSSTAAPSLELTGNGGQLPAAYTYSGTSGTNFYVRLKGCLANGSCSVFSDQGFKVLPYPDSSIGPPTGIVIQLTVPTS